MKRSMTTSAVIIPMFWLHLIVATIRVGFCCGCSSAGCRLSENGALLKFKNDLTDPSNRLASWVSDEDCCRWSGVVRNNLTGHVLELYLGTHISYDVNLASTASVDLEDNRGSKLGGKISSSLLYLKYLRYLDLSNNDFGGIHIPKFLGSMRNLRYLSLSHARIGGMIPHELGNL
jgi:Leucine-rich repeat (LRR) protein